MKFQHGINNWADALIAVGMFGTMCYALKFLWHNILLALKHGIYLGA